MYHNNIRWVSTLVSCCMHAFSQGLKWSRMNRESLNSYAWILHMRHLVVGGSIWLILCAYFRQICGNLDQSQSRLDLVSQSRGHMLKTLHIQSADTYS